jgi:hypothetical protein
LTIPQNYCFCGVGGLDGVPAAPGELPGAALVCGFIPGKGLLEVGIGSVGAFALAVGVGEMLGIVPEVVGVGIEAVAGFGTGPAAVDVPGTGIGPSATLSNSGGAAESGADGLAGPPDMAFSATGDCVAPAAACGVETV